MKIFVGYTGGHPLRLDNALIIQDAAREALVGLAQSFVPPSETIAFLQGAVITEGSGETSITDGWMLVEGEIFRIPAKTVGVTGLNNLKLVKITQTPDGYPDTVNYRDSGPQEVYKETILDFRDTGDPDGEGDPIAMDSYIYRVAPKPKRTVEMFAPADALSNYFNLTSGIGKGDCLGYALCDGQDGRPDLRGRFIVGYKSDDTDYNAIGKTGGSKEVTLTGAQSGIKAHNVGTAKIVVATREASDITHTPGVWDGGANGFEVTRTLSVAGASADQAHENRPPFYSLVFMIKL